MNKVIQAVVPPAVYKTVTKDYGYKLSQIPDLTGRTALITGGTNGIGLYASRVLHLKGVSRLILLSSTKSTADDAIAFIKTGDLSSAPSSFGEGFGSNDVPAEVGIDAKPENGQKAGEVIWKKVSLEDLKEVRKVAEEIAKEEKRLDLFLGVAGIGVNEFETTEEGYDKHLVINNLSHVLLVNRLLPTMQKTAKIPGSDVRIVQMSSELHRATMGGPGPVFGGDKLSTKSEFKQELGPNNLYARTKLAVLLFTKGLINHIPSLASASSNSGIKVYATHPGAVSTGQQEQFEPAYGETVGKVMGTAVSWAMRSPANGAWSLIWSAVSTEAREGDWKQGTYFTDPAELGKESSESDDPELIENFWKNSQEIIEEVAGKDALVSWNAVEQDETK